MVSSVIPVDGVMERALGKVDLIKIDCEGMEMEVLEGARDTLKAHKPWLTVEVADDNPTPLDDLLKETHTRDRKFNHTPTWVYKPLRS